MDSWSPNGAWAHVLTDGAQAGGLGHRLHGCNWKEPLRGELSD